MRTRDQVHGGARESRLSSDWNEYKSPRYEARKNYFRNKLEENRSKPKAFWATSRQVLPSKKNCS